MTVLKQKNAETDYEAVVLIVIHDYLRQKKARVMNGR